jgi:hypothetical protein
MKLSDFIDVMLNFGGKVGEDVFGKFPNIKGVQAGLKAVISAKGEEWFLNMPVVKPWAEHLKNFGVYSPEANEGARIDNDALADFLGGYVGTGADYKIGRLTIDNASLKTLAKKIKEAADD